MYNRINKFLCFFVVGFSFLLASCGGSTAVSWDAQVDTAIRVAQKTDPTAKLLGAHSVPEKKELGSPYKTNFMFRAEGAEFSVIVPDRNPQKAYVIKPPCDDCHGEIVPMPSEEVDQLLLLTRSVKVGPATVEQLTRPLAFAHVTHDYPKPMVVSSYLILPGDPLQIPEITDVAWCIEYQFVSSDYGSDNHDSANFWFRIYVDSHTGQILAERVVPF